MSDDDEPEHCEVCLGRFGDPFATMVFILDDDPKVVPMRVCQDCVGAMVDAMTEQWNRASMGNAGDVKEICRVLGIDGLVRDE